MTSNLPEKIVYEIEGLINYHFHNRDLLEEALSHPSLKQEKLTRERKNYEKLELLGDSILGFLVTELLFENFAKYSEGDIAKIKSYLVSKDILSEIGSKLKLSEFLVMTRGEELSGGRQNPNNLENTLEAIIAAIYLDSNIETVRDFIKKFWTCYLDNINFSQIDPKTALQDWSQKNIHTTPTYNTISKAGSPHDPLFTVEARAGEYVGIGHGKSIKSAEKEAAKDILLKLGLK